VYLKYISMALHLFFCPGATAIPYCRLVPLTYTYSSHKHFRWWTFWENKKEKDDGHFLVKHCPWRIYTKQTFFLPRGYASKIFSKSLSSTHYSIGWNLWVSSNTCETPHDLVGPISKILRPIWISIYRTQCVSYFIG
jgi:hypothetical protein